MAQVHNDFKVEIFTMDRILMGNLMVTGSITGKTAPTTKVVLKMG